MLDGTWHTYEYDGARVLKESATGLTARYTNASGSYYSPMLSLKVDGVGARYPLYDAVGTARMLVDGSATVKDTYSLDAFGAEYASSTGSTHNPYRFGGAWGYINDPSGMLQLGARFYWPEIGRFIQQDPIGDGMNWYVYAGGNPVVFIDPRGLDAVIKQYLFWGDPVLVFDEGSWDQLGMSSGATLSGLASGATFGLWSPDWTDPCDQYAAFSRSMGTVSGGILSAAGTAAAAEAIAARAAAPALQAGRASRTARLVAEANARYPKLAAKGLQRHHVFPKYLGGPANGRVAEIPAAYHQMITNAFRAEWAYGQGAPSAERAVAIMAKVYSRFPLP